MNIALASAWRPRGEMQRFLHIYKQIEPVYSAIAISLPPSSDLADIAPVEKLPKISLTETQDWSWGRHAALRLALESGADFIHYADFDRLVRWVETQPKEWQDCVEEIIPSGACTIFERSEKAWSTHPRALRQTEQLSNLTLSHFLGRIYDLSAGSKSFSRGATQFILANSPEIEGHSGRALGTDGEWVLLLHRGGYTIKSNKVDGLDWENADRYQEKAASVSDQQLAAQAYDANPQNWEQRVLIAKEIIEAGLEAAQRPLIDP
jgi:hypothetical protein